MIGVHRCSLVVDGREVAVFAEATVIGAGSRPTRAPVGRHRHAAGRHPPGVARVRTQLLPGPLRGDRRTSREVLAGEARPTAATVLTCDYIQEMAP